MGSTSNYFACDITGWPRVPTQKSNIDKTEHIYRETGKPGQDYYQGKWKQKEKGMLTNQTNIISFTVLKKK